MTFTFNPLSGKLEIAYTHPTDDGNLHVPATGTSNNGKVLTAGATAGSLSWTTINVPVVSVAGRTGAITLTKSDVGLANVDNTTDANKPISTATQTALNLKANLADPTFTGVPLVPTAAVGTNTTQIATTAFVNAEIANDAPSKTGTGASGTWSISVTGNAGTVTNGLYSTGSYADPAWITSLNYSKLTGTVPTWNQNTTGSAATLTTGRTISLTGDVSYTSGSFNGSANVTAVATLASVGTAGTYTKVTTDAKGRVTSGTTLVASDIPALDASKITTGTIDAARLPSYVDDVVEAANLASLPVTGETGKIYVALDTNKTYRWSGSAYVYITSGAVDSVAGKTGIVTLVKGDIGGLDNVDNTADINKSVASAATLTTARTINDVSFNGSADILIPSLYDASYRRVTNPGGGAYVSNNTTSTGALTIALPTSVYGQSKMVTFRVTVYEYLTGESIQIQLSGYQYSAGNWLNVSGYILAQSNINRNFTIRFAKDTTNLRYVVHIGELSEVWSYPQVFITDVQNGYGSNQSGWETGWSIYFEPTAFATLGPTISNPQIGYSSTANTANALVLRDASGNFAANAVTLTSIQSTAAINVLNAGAAQGIKIGNLVVSNSYANNAPTNGIYVTGQVQSGVAAGTAPFNVASTTLNTNLNADLLDGLHAASANTVSTVVARDASGNFSAGTITATLSGNATNVTGTVAIANGGTGATTAANARTNLGATTVGSNLLTVANPSAIRFVRINADNTVTLLDAETFREAIDASQGYAKSFLLMGA